MHLLAALLEDEATVGTPLCSVAARITADAPSVGIMDNNVLSSSDPVQVQSIEPVAEGNSLSCSEC